MKLINKIRSFSLARDTRGLSTVEYVIVLCLIAAVSVGVWSKFGNTVRDKIKGSTATMKTLKTK